MSADKEAAACAHARVILDPEQHDDGSRTDRWVCLGCSSPFRLAALSMLGAAGEVMDLRPVMDPELGIKTLQFFGMKPALSESAPPEAEEEEEESDSTPAEKLAFSVEYAVGSIMNRENMVRYLRRALDGYLRDAPDAKPAPPEPAPEPAKSERSESENEPAEISPERLRELLKKGEAIVRDTMQSTWSMRAGRFGDVVIGGIPLPAKVPEAAPSGKVVHGVSCRKAPHTGSGYLHGADDDSVYDVDGVDYCGRCHVVLPATEAQG